MSPIWIGLKWMIYAKQIIYLLDPYITSSMRINKAENVDNTIKDQENKKKDFKEKIKNATIQLINSKNPFCVKDIKWAIRKEDEELM